MEKRRMREAAGCERDGCVRCEKETDRVVGFNLLNDLINLWV